MHKQTRAPWWRTGGGIALIGFGLVAVFYVLREHYEHARGALRYALLLACPLMHLFMRRGHGGTTGATRCHGASPQAG
ncbi:DUF2933 domain-containing protein [Siccirubricoccus sp. KC 17139]|uniref:DUF2933 domain-containing protein n=1 Tax=Siccirubricoccus soli TaxID=2899147 RepID=A0ABT1D5A5_9PROT|nr:DUF2933 domain-containing protein [Siccirubricoccus soli]MCO6416190.1 DUF2933 domain-containing protein [Siccirubricoccus soli]MCP2682324.1 DUF2933 domain-containing protein [Siccirubricoccus soli]